MVRKVMTDSDWLSRVRTSASTSRAAHAPVSSTPEHLSVSTLVPRKGGPRRSGRTKQRRSWRS